MKVRERNMRVTCNDCGYSSDIAYMEIHSCDVQQNGGHCEDWPSCGHRWGECQNLPEFTGKYWSEILADPKTRHMAYEPGSPEWYDALDDRDATLGDED